MTTEIKSKNISSKSSFVVECKKCGCKKVSLLYSGACHHYDTNKVTLKCNHCDFEKVIMYTY